MAGSDTLSGLALRYGVSERDIQAANRTSSREVFMFKTLLIPVAHGGAVAGATAAADSAKSAEAHERQRLERAMAAALKIDRLEARFYLEATKYNLKRAKRAYKRDEAAVAAKPFAGSVRCD